MANRRGNGAGNVMDDDAPAGAREPCDFKAGDVVAMTPAALSARKLSRMGPRVLHDKAGWPNEFGVKHAFDHPEHGPCLVLYPCCFRLVADRATGGLRCKGHDAAHFERIAVRAPGKGDKGSSIAMPFLGELMGFDFEDGDGAATLRARLFGKEAVLTGEFARIAKALAEGAKIL